jgi:hypothetical protein
MRFLILTLAASALALPRPQQPSADKSSFIPAYTTHSRDTVIAFPPHYTPPHPTAVSTSIEGSETTSTSSTATESKSHTYHTLKPLPTPTEPCCKVGPPRTLERPTTTPEGTSTGTILARSETLKPSILPFYPGLPPKGGIQSHTYHTLKSLSTSTSAFTLKVGPPRTSKKPTTTPTDTATATPAGTILARSQTFHVQPSGATLIPFYPGLPPHSVHRSESATATPLSTLKVVPPMRPTTLHTISTGTPTGTILARSETLLPSILPLYPGLPSHSAHNSGTEIVTFPRHTPTLGPGPVKPHPTLSSTKATGTTSTTKTTGTSTGTILARSETLKPSILPFYPGLPPHSGHHSETEIVTFSAPHTIVWGPGPVRPHPTISTTKATGTPTDTPTGTIIARSETTLAASPETDIPFFPGTLGIPHHGPHSSIFHPMTRRAAETETATFIPFFPGTSGLPRPSLHHLHSGPPTTVTSAAPQSTSAIRDPVCPTGRIVGRACIVD